MEDSVNYDSSDEYSNYGENMLEPQVILGDGLQDSSDYEDARSSSSMLEVQIDDRFAPHDADEDEASDSYFSGAFDDSSIMDSGRESRCDICSESLSLHFAGQPCGTFDEESSSQFMETDSNSEMSNGVSSLKTCPVCRGKNPSREHLANHFLQELAECLEGETQCSKCDFRVANTSKASVKNQSKMLALHHVTDHGGAELDELLTDLPLVQSKRDEFESKRPSLAGHFGGGHRLSLPPHCPICNQALHKSHSRDHVSWHFMDELRNLITDPSQCPECSYTGDKLEAVSRHLALYHCKLDEFLKDPELVAAKRAKAMAKPKKVSIGPSCLICGLKDPSREHVSRHFMKELMEIINELPDPMQCPECTYKGEKSQNLARHIALVHSKLDELLADEDLVESRRQEHMAKPNKVNIGDVCPVCDTKLTKQQNARVHLIWHFIDELRAIVNNFEDNTACGFCDYTNTNSDKVVKHIALGHSKLDEMLANEDLLQQKRALAQLKPKKQSIGPLCPVCDIKDPPREHVARHFSDELNDYVSKLPDQQQCVQCGYRGERAKNLGLHIALVHGRLDILLNNKKLVRAKRSKYLAQPKKQIIGPLCPICDIVFTKSQNRDHVAWHFIEELREFVQSFSDPRRCWKCEYTSDKMDNLVKHVALGHSQLDELLADPELVAAKRAQAMSRPKKVAIVECPICDIKEPAREHVARHFSEELMAIVSEFPDPSNCVECEYKADKPKTLSIHVALVHARLDMFLLDSDLVASKREIFMSKPKKLNIGPNCPVCSIKFTKTQNRDHVAWHYMDELRAIVQEFEDPNQCPQCPYTSDTNEKMVKHVALGHSMLDALLQDDTLLEQKRAKVMSKPRKVTLGLTCPVCDAKEPSREHTARHFSDELVNIVMDFDDPGQCTECSYKSDKPKNVAIHIALVHAILDHFLANETLVKEKRESYVNKPQRVNVGSQCPVCDMAFAKGTNRDHICWHFMEELRDYVLGFHNTQACNECSYTSDKLDNLAKHVALGHARLDTYLQDEDLVAQKREIVMNKPKKINIGPTCPVCDLTFTKSQNRDHVSWHFMDEFRDFVQQTGSEKACQLCYYTTDKPDNLLKHYALGHSKLDELLQDEELIAKKREIHQQKPKRLSLGPDCVVCGVKGRDRDHMARHYMTELMELVHALPRKNHCNLCDYKNQKQDYLAKHLALFHCKLDELLLDEDLLKDKRAKFANQPKRVAIGDSCVICGSTSVSREHVCRHFLPELLAIVNTYNSPLSCGECEFSATKSEYVARHLGLVHLKLDEFLQDSDLVAKKVKEYESTVTPKLTPVIEANLRKSTRQKVPTAIFQPELLEVNSNKRKTSSTSLFDSPSKPSKVARQDLLTFAGDKSESMEVEIGFNGGAKAKVAISSPKPIKKEPADVPSSSIVSRVTPEVSLLKRSPVVKPEVKTPLKSANSAVKKPANPLMKATTETSLLRTSLLKPEIAALKSPAATSSTPALPSSITLSPAVPNLTPASGMFKKSSLAAAMPTKPDPKMIEEVNNSWAQSLMSKSKRPKGSSPTYPDALFTLKPTPLPPVSLTPVNAASTSNKSMTQQQRVSPVSVVPSSSSASTKSWSPSSKFLSANIVAVNGSKTAIPLPQQPVKVDPASLKYQNIDYNDLVEESEDDEGGEGNLFEPQVILNTSANEDSQADAEMSQEEEEEFEDVEEFCDVCSMELINHADDMPCEPTDAYTKLYKYCRVCDVPTPTREHVSRHFLPELLEVVDCFPNPLACTQCDYQAEMSTTVALHIALVHFQLDEYLEDHDLVRIKRKRFSSKTAKVDFGDDCPVCYHALTRQYKKDHVVWHYMEDLKQIVVSTVPFDGIAYKCMDCDYFIDKIENMARHLGLYHSKLDMLLQDNSLLEEKRLKASASTRPTKREPINLCPICDFKDPSREHVSRHFMNELLDHVATLPDNYACSKCSYKGERPQNLAKHIALVHSMLDEFLKNEELVKVRRSEIMAKPKKISIGSVCPVCKQNITKRDSRVHVIWHFMDDLRAMVQEFSDPQHCELCPYTNPNVDKMAKHMALGHSKLDELLGNEEIVREKQEVAMAKPKRLSIGPSCPICGLHFTKGQNRDHVCWHFMEELRDYVLTFDSPTACNQCSYSSDKLDNLVKHVALGHAKLDELLLNEELVESKRALARAKPKKLTMGPSCPICDIVFSKNQNRDHVTWHFIEELREIVDTLPDPTTCTMCEYTSDKIDNLVKHIALGHSKLDEFLMDEELVARKRQQVLAKPKRVNVDQCPICFVEKPPRAHLVHHFMEELLEAVEFSDDLNCAQCEFRGDSSEMLAKHIGLFHGKLDEYLMDAGFVAQKRNLYHAKQEIVASPSQVQCIVCDAFMVRQNLRKHCAEHFTTELEAIIHEFESPNECTLCTESGAAYSTANRSTMCLHVALAHSRLEEMLADDVLVKAKRVRFGAGKSRSLLKNGTASRIVQKPEPEVAPVLDDDEESLVEDEDDDDNDGEGRVEVKLDLEPSAADDNDDDNDVPMEDEDYEEIIYEEDEDEEEEASNSN